MGARLAGTLPTMGSGPLRGQGLYSPSIQRTNAFVPSRPLDGDSTVQWNPLDTNTHKY